MLAAATLAAAGSLRPLQPEQEQRGGPNDAGGSSTSKLPEAEAAQNFVIFSRARSGTTWLISMLNGHPEVSCDGELLLRVKTDAALSDFYEAFDRTGRLHEGTKARERSKRLIGAQGFKWFHYQAGIELFEPYYSWNSDNATRAGHDARAQEWAAWLRRHRFKVVVFEREDRLGRMVSEAKHNMLMDYVCTTEKCVDEHRRRKVYLKPEHLKLKLRDDEELGTGTMGWLGRHGFDASQTTRVTYRELVAEPEERVRRLYGFLGVDQKQPVRVNATMKMDTAAKLADEIENLQEVEAALQGTKYLKELYDLQFFGYSDM